MGYKVKIWSETCMAVRCLQTCVLADCGENGPIDRQKFQVEYVAFQLCVCVGGGGFEEVTGSNLRE
jgi:hypothetical protein